MSKRMRVALLGALAALAALVPASSASAVQLNGGWAPYNRCPVDDPQIMGAVYPDTTGISALCVAASSPNGELKIRKTTTETGASDLQFGLLLPPPGDAFVAVNPPGGAITGDPVKVPGGLLNLSRNAGPGALGNLARTVDDTPVTRVMAQVEPAGPVSDFDLFAGLGVGEPIITVPIKIQLINPVLGDDCYIGSDEDPIVLHPANTNIDNAELVFQAWDADGTLNPDGKFGELAIEGLVQGDDQFAVPRADGCGPGGTLDGLVNSQAGLPSPAGKNHIVLNDVRSGISGVLFPEDGEPVGQEVHDAWHSAVLP